jgi:hypothetical protein
MRKKKEDKKEKKDKKRQKKIKRKKKIWMKIYPHWVSKIKKKKIFLIGIQNVSPNQK